MWYTWYNFCSMVFLEVFSVCLNIPTPGILVYLVPWSRVVHKTRSGCITKPGKSRTTPQDVTRQQSFLSSHLDAI